MSDTPAIAPVPVAGTSPATARRLIALGWTVDDEGRWTNGTVSCDATTALAVAETVAKVAPAAPASPGGSWWTHLASSMPGTAGVGILSAIATYVIANPPPEAGLSPQAAEWIKWGLAMLGAILLGIQVPRSMAATAPQATAPQATAPQATAPKR